MPRCRSVRTRRAESEWTGVVGRFRASGLSTREFCRRHGVSLSSLERWCRRLRPAARAEFVELVAPAVVSTPQVPAWSVEVVLPNGACLRFRE
jgi:transposase